MTSLNKAKALKRESLLEQRNRLSAENEKTFSTKIRRVLLELPEILAARHIGLYWSHRGEVSTSEVFGELLRRGKTVHFPRVRTGSAVLDFVAIDDARQLIKGHYGVLEPRPEFGATPLEEIEVIVVPGIAFDARGHRIGWGKGYYDVTFERFSGKRIALAYDFQVLDEVPADKHDQSVQVIVTELRVIHCGR